MDDEYDQINNFIGRIKFHITKEFYSTGVIFLYIDDNIGRRISFYCDPSDKRALSVFDKLIEKEKQKIDIGEFVKNKQWDVELYTDNYCINLTLHDNIGESLHLRCCNEKMYFYFVDFMESLNE